MRIPLFVCSKCAMTSTRKESVRRHIKRFHAKEETFVVPFINYLAGVTSGIYPPRSPFRHETNKMQDLADRVAEEVNLEMARQSARRHAAIAYGGASTAVSTPSILHGFIQDAASTRSILQGYIQESVLGFSASICSACSGIYLNIILFARNPKTFVLHHTHNTATCSIRQFPALADQELRNQINNANKEAISSVIYQEIVDWTKGKPCLIALKVPQSSESFITVVRKNNHRTNSLTLAKSGVTSVSFQPSNTDLYLLFKNAITEGSIRLSNENLKIIVDFVKQCTFWLLEMRGHAEHFMAIVPENGSEQFYVEHPEGKTDVQAESGVKSPVPRTDIFMDPMPQSDMYYPKKWSTP